MARQTVPLLSFNRGVISPKGLARVDLDRTRLSAERMNNWLPSTLGPMSIRPGTKYFGSSRNDTGAEYLEFVASTDDVALLEVTDSRMRVWLGEDAHALELLSRPAVDTDVSLSDTGWDDASTGGIPTGAGEGTDIIPPMTGATTAGVEMTASSELTNIDTTFFAYQAGDDRTSTMWIADDGLPNWLNVDFGAGSTKKITSYSLRSADNASLLTLQPAAWRLIGSNHDTGTFATDTGKWTLEDERSAQTGWAVSEKRSYTAQNDTGQTAWRHWRLHVVTVNGGLVAGLAEIELFSDTGGIRQVDFGSAGLTLNATSIGALAKATKRVVVSDTGTEHALDIRVSRGPVTLRVGSTDGDDDYIREASLGTGTHNLAFTPQGNFWITVQSDALVDRIVSSLAIADSGTVELTAPWGHSNLDSIRYDQSADVMFANCAGVRPAAVYKSS